MKREIEKITYVQLIDLLCASTYASRWLDCDVNQGIRKNLDIKEGDCREDVWVKALKAGYRIEAIDFFAEGTLYGTLGTATTCDAEENGHYLLCLDDIKRGLQAAWDGTFKTEDEKEKDYARKCVSALLEQDRDFDSTAAETLMQIIMFGEWIYG